MATKITRDVLESHLRCKTKAFLKLAGEQGQVSDYEALLAAGRQEMRRRRSSGSCRSAGRARWREAFR